MRRTHLAMLAGALAAGLLLGKAITVSVDEHAALEETLRDYVKGTDLILYIHFEDLATGATVGFRDREPIQAGSAIKVPLVLYLYTLAREGRVDLGEEIALQPEDFDHTGESWEPGLRPLTLRELALAALEVSDNVATNALFRRLGRDNLYAFMRGQGPLVLPTGPAGGNLTCARDVTAYFKALLRFRAESGRFGEEPLSFLYDTPFHDRLVAYLPWDLRVAHKVATFENVVGDAGIVFLPGRPYVLSVFVRHPWRDEEDEEAAARAIAEVSYLVYEHQNRLVRR